MPEQPAEKIHSIAVDPPTSVAPCAIAYAELAVTTNFSFLRGASHPDEMVYQAAILGYRAIAITDLNSLAGVVRAHTAATKCGMKLLIGARLTLVDGPDILVWTTDRASYGRLCRLLTLGKNRAPKGECHLGVADLAAGAQGSHRCGDVWNGRGDRSPARNLRARLFPRCRRFVWRGRCCPPRAGGNIRQPAQRATARSQRCALSRPRPRHAPGCTDLHPPRLHTQRRRLSAIPQSRAPPEAAGANARIVLRISARNRPRRRDRGLLRIQAR